ncbi:rad2 superfamily protein mus201 [Arctopsyche grandis]|uniref:rad2 superfamily protein mus201 n=1 Tax=Arctopsyche grandis TaxID=121162 RepID=UPI00406D9FEE
MGVTGLWRLVDSTGRAVHLDSLRGRVLAVDISIWLYQMVKGYQDGKGAAVSYSHLLGLFQRLCKLLYYGIRPIFVFDGAFPALKKQTIINRQNKKSQARNDVDKVQRQLMEVITKHIAVKNSLTPNQISSISISPKKKMAVANEEDMFKLPSISAEPSEVASDSSDEEVTDKESISSKYQIDLHSFDVNSDYFKALSAKEKHDLLTELKETRKANSWGRINELPTQSNDFSDYQMKRLLKRRQVQVSLEEAEKEIGGHCLSINELEILLNEEGIDTKIHSIPTRQIASNENSHFLLVKNVKEAMNQAMQKEVAKNAAEKNNEPSTSTSSCQNSEQSDEVFDEDLEAAIKLSLECTNDKIVDLTSQKDNLSSSDEDDFRDESQLSKINATSERDLGIAKAYMKEYSGLSEFEIERILKNEATTSSKTSSKIQQIDKKLPKISDNPKIKDIIIIEEEQTEECIIIDEDTEIPEGINTTDNELTRFIEEEIEPSIEKSDVNIDDDALSSSSSESFEDVPENEQINEETPADDIFADVFIDKSKFHVLDNNILSHLKNKIEAIEKCDKNEKNPVLSNDKLHEMEKPTEKANVCETNSAVETETENAVPNILPSSLRTEPSKITLQDLDDVIIPETSSNKVDKAPNEAVLREMATEIEENLENQQNLLEREQNKLDRMGRNITDEMTKDAQNLLRLFGIPYIVAPTEAEAQCAYLESIKLTDGTITDDSDIWLFGGKNVYRNFFNQQKTVMQYVDTNISQSFKLQREDLILFALLVGSDYTMGVTGVGPVTALEVLAAFPRGKQEAVPPYTSLLQGLQKFRDWSCTKRNFTHSSLRSKLKNVKLGEEFPSAKIIEAYLCPEVEKSSEAFSWGTPDIVALRDYTKEKFGWSREKTDEILNPVLKRLNIKETQRSIKSFFNTEFKLDVAIEKMSKRVKNAVENMHSEPSNSEAIQKEQQIKRKQPNENKRVRKTKEGKGKKMKIDNPENIDLIARDEIEGIVPQIENITKDIAFEYDSQQNIEMVPLKLGVAKPVDLQKKNNLFQNNKSAKSVNVKVLPELQNNKGETIPQRENDRNIILKNKMKAIELFRKSKKGPGFVNKRKAAVRQPKDEAELSESSNSD